MARVETANGKLSCCDALLFRVGVSFPFGLQDPLDDVLSHAHRVYVQGQSGRKQ
jgi:hypothetical protein